MSASLVGSEMCIRDSPVPAKRPGCAAPEKAAPRGHKLLEQSLEVEVAVCLLYTSDAADDM
eukprot:12491609-Alexandrium_andersonii.AAC.1